MGVLSRIPILAAENSSIATLVTSALLLALIATAGPGLGAAAQPAATPPTLATGLSSEPTAAIASPDGSGPLSSAQDLTAGMLDPQASSLPMTDSIERLPAVGNVEVFAVPADSTSAQANYYDPFSNQFAYGNRGAQPYRLGWLSYDDGTYMPTSRVHGTTGTFQDVEWNAWMRYSRGLGDHYLFSWTPAWNTKFWTGPSGVALPADADQIISDFQLSSTWGGPWNWQLGFTPQINADFRRSLDSNAYMFDGRGVVFYQASANWRWAFGAAYWNRVVDRVIPYGGVIWAPDDRWEFRLFFPKTRISRYWGEVHGVSLWNYVSLEYNVQAYQLELQQPGHVKTRGQFSNNQLLVGLSGQRGGWSTFVEGGLVFDRHVGFRGSTPGFGISDALIARAGLLY
jgi:hypothetical protein